MLITMNSDGAECAQACVCESGVAISVQIFCQRNSEPREVFKMFQHR